MFQSSIQKTILIVEPNLSLERPYAFLDQKKFQITRISNSLTASNELQKQTFDLVFLSCSFSNKKILNFLESLKNASKKTITPLLLVIDANQPYSVVPGLIWANKVGLLSSNCSSKELELQLDKLL